MICRGVVVVSLRGNAGSVYPQQIAHDTVGQEDTLRRQSQTVVGFFQSSAVDVRFCHLQTVAIERFAVCVSECGQVHAFHGAYSGDDALVVTCVFVQVFRLGNTFGRVCVLYIAVEVCRVPLSTFPVERMCGRSATQIVRTAPITAVVPGMTTGQTKVGDFVVLVTGTCEFFHQCGKEFQTVFFVYFADASLLSEFPQRRVFFVDKVISGDMFGAECYGLLQVVRPALMCFARQSVHQVYADVIEPLRPATGKGFQCTVCGVSSAEHFQCRFVKGLYPHADAVERQVAQHRYVCFRQVVGIGFDGDFSIGRDVIMRVQCVEYVMKIRFRELRGRTAAEVHRVDTCVGEIVAPQLQFPTQSRHEGFSLFGLCGGIEIAIHTPALAKGDM